MVLKETGCLERHR